VGGEVLVDRHLAAIGLHGAHLQDAGQTRSRNHEEQISLLYPGRSHRTIGEEAWRRAVRVLVLADLMNSCAQQNGR
jgi:hypothetical protein